MVTEVEYQRVRENTDAEIRQLFLDRIDLGETARYVRHVMYIPRDVKVKGKHALFDVETDERISDIKVYPRAFVTENLDCLGNFLSALIYHEGYHAEEMYDDSYDRYTSLVSSMREVNTPYADEIGNILFGINYYEAEVRAFTNQFEAFDNFDVSDKYRNLICRLLSRMHRERQEMVEDFVDSLEFSFIEKDTELSHLWKDITKTALHRI